MAAFAVLVFLFQAFEKMPRSILYTCFVQLQVIEGDGLPALICNKCISRLNIAYQFKQQCESSDSRLRQYFNSLQQLPPAPDLTGFTLEIKKDNLTFDDQIQHQQQQQPQQQQQQPEQQITTAILQIPQQIIEAGTSQPVKKEDDILKTETEIGNNGLDIKNEDAKEKKKQTKQHQCDTCGKVFRTKPGLIHHIRIHTGERPYLCHLCNKRFINGGHLHTHMRTHTGEKNHVCSACSKAFATAQQLTKHTIAIHTSERPYGCTYCMKRFASSSNLNTHIKIHTGEKNYHCDQCGKAFSTKGQLYQHMLVHTGEKAFLCEYCNKRFSQKAHLIRHLKMHKG